MDRRDFLKGSAVAMLAAGLTPLSSVFSKAMAASSEPIRIGLMAPMTGVVASGGREIVDGFKLWFDMNGYEVAGRKIEILEEDDASNPEIALQKARRLVQQYKVHMLVGNLLANTGLAVAEFVKETGTPYFIPVIAADNLTQRDRIPNVIRVAGYSASQMPRPIADYALKQGFKTVVTIAQDYTFGHEQCGGFCQTFTEGGGKVLDQLWHPLNNTDYGPYLSKIMGLKPDLVFSVQTGADSTRVVQQYASFGLKGRIPLYVAMNVSDQSVIRTMGEECDGLISAAQFAEGSTDKANVEFVEAYSKAYDKLPSLYAFTHFTGGMWITQALSKVSGDAENRNSFLDAVRTTELIDTPLGPKVTLDVYGNPIYDVYIRKVVKRDDGKYWNVPIEKYPQVSQFWKYDPETYLKQPSYSRDFQGYKK